ncbi:MAG: hypothetical protein KAU21_07440 [Gammaproteobacteria bacterium]|nr:hypothetical protein [Gammaproteobacteria bacterium]
MNNETKIPLLQDLLYKGQAEEEKEVEQHQPALSTDENTDFEIEQDEVDIELSHEQESLPEEISQETPQKKHPKKINTDTQQLILDEEIRMILDKYMDKACKKIIRLLNERKP